MMTAPIAIATLLLSRLPATLALADAGVAPGAARSAITSPALILVPVNRTPTTGEPTADQYRLERAKDGSGELLYDAASFKARIARDGSVAFRDKHMGALSLIPSLPGPPSSNVPTLEGVIRRRGRKDPKALPSDPAADETRWPEKTVSRYRPDPREACTYPSPCFFDAAAVLVGARGGVDLTDEVMRLGGRDPYRFQKARFLTATRELRIRMAGRAHAEDIQRSASDLQRRLDDIVCDERLSLNERRGIIQALRAELDSSTDADQFAAPIAGALQRLQNADGGADGSPPPRCAPTGARDAESRRQP